MSKHVRSSAPPLLCLDSTPVGEAEARLRPNGGDTEILVLGVGDVRFGDMGAGVHVVRQLEREPPIPGVRLLAGATGGANLLPELDGVRALIVVTAAHDGGPAGTITYSQPHSADDLPCEPGSAGDGLGELFSAAQLLGRLPATHLYTISVTGAAAPAARLSTRIAEAMAVATCTVHGHATRLAARPAAS